MSQIARLIAYAAAFEKTFESDDFAHVEPFFTEDAVYETLGGPPFDLLSEGREAVFAHLKDSLDGLDRRFETREVELLEGPEERENGVWFRWKARYTKPGLPALEMEGEETASFEGDRIRRLEDRFTPESVKATAEYLATHAAALGITR